jgi:hypothetical protein
MRKAIIWYLLFLTLLATGCILPVVSVTLPTATPETTPEIFKTSTPELTKTKLPVLESTWTIRMKHSGGIMGLLRTIEISSDGSSTVVDERTKKTVNGKLSSDELSIIKEQILASEYISPAKPEAICADCFVYDLEIQGSGKKFAVQLNDISLPDSGLEELVRYLRGLIDTALK